MKRKFSRNYSLSLVAPFIAILILLIAAPMSAQTPGADQRSAQHVLVPAQQDTGAVPQRPLVPPPPRFAPVVTYSTGGYQTCFVATGDLRGDGIQDLVAISGGGVSVLLGNGDGTFQSPVNYSSGGSSVAVGDLRGDGILDLVTLGAGAVGVLLGNGDGTFQAAVPYDTGVPYTGSAPTVALGDVTGTGILDVVVPGAVLLGNGDGTFQAPIGNQCGGVGVAVGDLNGDGKLDMVSSDTSVSVCLGNGDGTFRPAVSYNCGAPDCSDVAVADLRGNGISDLVVANYDANTVSVLLGNGDGTFQPAVSYGTGQYGYDFYVAVADVNGDGVPDLLGASIWRRNNSYSAGGVSVLLGNGDGTFRPAHTYNSGGYNTLGVAAADVNGDGTPDLLVVNAGYPPNGFSGSVGVLLNLAEFRTTTTITSSLNPSLVNQSVMFTATVTSPASIPNGSTVTFYRGTTEIGTGTTTNGVATLTTSFSEAGTYAITASFARLGARKHSSATLKQSVDKYTTTTALTSVPNPSNYGQAVTLTATVTPTGNYAPTGKVIFKNGAATLGAGTLNAGGVATLTTAKIPVGANTLASTYNGDAFNGESVSAAIRQTVSQASISMVLTSTPNPSTFGKSVRFTATLTSSGGLPSGQPVTFSYNGTTLGTANVTSKGVATFSTTTLPKGSDAVTAAYAGSVDYSSASAKETQVVN